jgi:CHAD domain-containing protein
MRKYVQQQTAALLRKLAAQVNRASATGDPGAIHDLRVAIRRLSRGLRVFAPFYPDKFWKRIREQLRHLMQTAGAVRDRDIALECLAQAGVAKRAPIVTRLQAERRQASHELLTEIRRWKEQGISREWRQRLAVPLRPNERSAPRLNAHRSLPRLAGEYFAQVRAVLAESSDARDLHRARLATKRFRYTLELFRSCYGPGLETRIATLRRVQQLLGDVNDRVASWTLLSKAMAQSPQRKMVHAFLRHKARHDAAAFRLEWTENFDAPGRERWWKTYLAGRRASSKLLGKTA